ncbi:hypothetical protein FNH05_03050 [Amycolatopsis rhizosphaerae]|uniref:NIPSNAP family containing protein n=1 Tax=Amycolatopsis rhizosphaerae TaxID=2053003 RepID=A0A558DK24_9PSEU|nr:hypothetical protein [Amycolatopsis rhizosphaerae]TVT61334.1 hypothetical protein FNH05_03050 [Amycolatopsis rhizosphaerae]
MFAPLAFFSFVRLTDPARYREYNEWHQLDHRPENLLLPGVAWGERWAATADCAELMAAPAAEYSALDFVAMYWFRDPVERSVAEWSELAERSFQWGRRPELSYVERPFLGFFTPVKGYVAPRVLVSPEALPFRPNRGIRLSLTRLAAPHSLEAEQAFRHYDTVAMPELLAVPGVAGGWTFSFSYTQRHATTPRDGGPDFEPGSLRLRLLFLDEDPVEVEQEIRRREAAWDTGKAEELLLSGPLRRIIPWQDW